MPVNMAEAADAPALHQASVRDCRMRRKRLIRPTFRHRFVGMIRRVSVASGDDRTDDQRYPFNRNNLNMRTCTEILAGADGP